MLEVEALSVSFPGPSQTTVDVVRQVSFEVARAEFVGLVGESGSGKSLTALSIIRLLPPNALQPSGRVWFDGVELSSLSEGAMRRFRGRRIGFIFQEPMTALNPVLTVGSQLREAIVTHESLSRRQADRRSLELLDQVTLADGRRRLGDYPHELSGGQRQRVMIALALAGKPDLLIADEPTTALDVTLQAQILALLEELRQQLGLSVLLITHDLGVVSEVCARVMVLYAGEVVESGATQSVLLEPAHPYTRQLLAALPTLSAVGSRSGSRSGSSSGFQPIPGSVPEPGSLPSGCSFHPRCNERFAACALERPSLIPLQDRAARCLLHDERYSTQREGPGS